MRLRRTYISAAAVVVVSSLGITAYHHTAEANPVPEAAPVVQDAPATPQATVPPKPPKPPKPQYPGQLPGLGPKTLSQIPARTRQVVLVTGAAKTSASSKVVLWERVDGGWRPGA
ncbi:hypothetical protein AB0F62_41905, partial [Streptomyces sp. NPDC026673]